MQLIKKQERLGEILFFIGILIHTLLMVIGYGDWSIPFHGRFMQLAFGLFCIKILCTWYTKQDWAVMIILGVIGALSYLYTGDEYVISIIVMIFAAKNIDMKRVCKWILVLSFVFTVGTALLSLMGVGGLAVDIRDYGRGSEEARWCLGFGHANNIHGTVWYLVMLVVFLYFEKLKWQHYLLVTIGNLGLFYLTASRGGMLAIQMAVIAALLLKYVPKIIDKMWIYLLGLLELVLFVVLSLISAIISPEFTPIISKIDNMLTGRLHLIRWYADMSKWKLFASGGDAAIIDDGWAAVFMSYGYVIGAVFILFHVYLIYKIWKKRSGILLIMFATTMFYTFMEASYTMNTAYLLSNFSYIIAMIFVAKSESGSTSAAIELLQ